MGNRREKLTAESAEGLPENQPISRPGKTIRNVHKKQEGDMEMKNCNSDRRIFRHGPGDGSTAGGPLCRFW